jgi:hypothetical protein
LPKLGLAVALLLLGLIGCGANDPEAAEGGGRDATETSGEPAVTEVELRPVGSSETTGTVTFLPVAGGGTEVRLALDGLPDPEGAYVGAIYRGSCSGETGAAVGGTSGQGARRSQAAYQFVHGDHDSPTDSENIVQTLTSVTSEPDGKGTSTTPLPIPIGELLSGEPKYVDVHGEGAEVLVCADLPMGHSSAT